MHDTSCLDKLQRVGRPCACARAGWDTVNASMAGALQLCLPSLQSLCISEAEKVDLAALAAPAWSGLAKLHVSS